MAPVLEERLGVSCLVPDDLDTDRFGTFSGEIERRDDPRTTAGRKCDLAMELTGCTLAIASEGSYGPHPAIPWLPAGEEWVVLVDRQRGWRFSERILTRQTNFQGREITSREDLAAFAQAVGFPDHGIILRAAPGDTRDLIKGICRQEDLDRYMEDLMRRHGKVFAETDMRALFNPTRMQQIRLVTESLVSRILQGCPHCGLPGFGVTGHIPGLPCSLCGLPTRAVLSQVLSCDHCGHREERPRSDGRTREDPMYCDHCNP